MNDMVLAPVDCIGLLGAAPAFVPAAKTGEFTADAARAPAAPASMSRRDRVGRDVSEVSFMFDFRNLGSVTGFPSKLLICFQHGWRMCASRQNIYNGLVSVRRCNLYCPDDLA